MLYHFTNFKWKGGKIDELLQKNNDCSKSVNVPLAIRGMFNLISTSKAKGHSGRRS